MKLTEFDGFFDFWIYSKAFWSLEDALRIFHNCRNAWDILDRKLDEAHRSSK